MSTWAQLAIWTAFVEGSLALVLTISPRLRPGGGRLARALAQAPLLDVVVSFLTWIPWTVGIGMGGWLGLLGVLTGQTVVLISWILAHEATHRHARRGPRIVKTLNRIVGRAPNHIALWVSLLALPGFLVIRLAECVVYPMLRCLLRFPGYRHAEWVNISRHKFQGLVGHDLIWCLYCDWMTGVYALGGEMLRNVESFWCPIRFHDAKKCDNCRVDFPDIDAGWAPAEGNLSEVESTLETMYGSGRREWYGHPARLTVSARQEDGEGPAPSPQPRDTHNGG